MIDARELTKTFGAVHAVRGVSFAVKRGEAVGFLGPNGAGKSTTFRLLAGTLAPDSGEVSIMGADLFRHARRAKQNLGYMAENAPLYPELTGLEYLNYRAELRGIKKRDRLQAVQWAAARSGAAPVLGRPIGHLSKGYRQRMALADALIGDPPILLLDEPTSGLDPNQVLETRRLIRELSKDHAVIISTHILSEVEATCQRAVVIDKGRIIAQGTLDELKKERTRDRAVVQVLGAQEAVAQALQQMRELSLFVELMPSVGKVHEFQLRSSAGPSSQQASDGQNLALAVRSCVQAGLDVVSACTVTAPLDEVFAHLTQEPEK